MAQKADQTLKLFAPKSYWSAPPDVVDAVTGGCGPGGFGDWLIPDTVWGLSVKPACRIHDWMYHVGADILDKEEADRTFANNMIRIIRAKTRLKILRLLRFRRARTYYWFVKEFGGPAFWDQKNAPEEFREVTSGV